MTNSSLLLSFSLPFYLLYFGIVHSFYWPCDFFLGPGVCWQPGHSLPWDQRQERHQRGTGLHDHGRRDQEEDGPWGHGWQCREVQREDPEQACQHLLRGLLLRSPPPQKKNLHPVRGVPLVRPALPPPNDPTSQQYHDQSQNVTMLHRDKSLPTPKKR